MQYFNIQVASQLSGVASATIRAWEKRYHAVHPERADNKHRLYSEKDIEKLTLLSQLTELGQSIGKIAALDLEELKVVYSTLLHRPYQEAPFVHTAYEEVDCDKILQNFQLAISAYKIDILSHEFEKVKDQLSPRDLCLKIIIPLFQQIGLKVENGEYSIAQEHAVSAIVKFHVGQVIAKHYQKSFIKKEMIVLTTLAGDYHEIGILAASLLLVHHSLKFVYLGPNMPAEALTEVSNSLDATGIILGATRGSDLEGQDSFLDYLNELSANLKKKPRIWVGGNLKLQHRSELEKKKIPFFSSLQALDEVLQKL